MNIKKNLTILVLLSVFIITSCTDDLNTEPEIEQTLGAALEEDPDAIKGLLAKLYGGLVLHGIGALEGDDQLTDIIGDDAGSTVYLRSLWNLQEMTSDLVKNRWGDDGLDPLTTTSGWVSTNKFLGYMYNRIYFQVGQINNFMLETEGLDFEQKEIIRAEARFLRALAYYHGMDLFGGIPLVTEADGIGGALKEKSTRAEVFTFVENELLAIKETIPASNEYGRANKATINMVLAKIYLNAEVYTGTSQYDKALSLSEEVINDSNFSLDDNYQSVFQGDNFTSPEIIFPLIGDRNNVQSFGNTTYLVNGSYNTETMNVKADPNDDDSPLLYSIADLGAQNGWAGHRCTKALYGLFGTLNDNSFDTGVDESDENNDKRAIFFTAGHSFEMGDYREWNNGYPTTKFRNSYAEGTAPVMNASDIDFPMFRLADAYLMYAEAHLNNGGGNRATALNLINELRRRAYGDDSGNISDAELTLDFIIDERARELYYEGHRRQDLIRFKRFTGGAYIWPWKGGTAEGTAIPANYNLFPIPLEALQANPNLKQNPGF
ncbi:RagB/SusD family nutrient uptake outer membrane protein [Aquimarina algicola]|uniref:RagB/SusD family nutrient uptake outer membrane protein n=1 Tax=Aquimarina algicola TaxID=2589995 RepID=A0A504J0Q3_9FLAO|nr:RagB/SusD family nutrient uptake outer membrane protein [Aquimarina algicola]TPN82185.1 RagB/SusD family nutrient uptake outer membrane protein [Aquimarina algicola]